MLEKRGISKRGQVTIFIILAVLVVVGIIAFFMLRGRIEVGMKSEFKPVYDYYISCMEESTREGVSLLGTQGGYIYLPEFEPGSAYRPFSNQLNFMGQAVPYWMYVSGNNLLKEQVPKKIDMESDLNKYVESRLESCDFSDFALQGFDVFVEEGRVDARINEQDVKVETRNRISIFYEGDSVVVDNHKFSVGTKLGKFYDMALKTYNFQKESAFLEDYALDVMYLYAPVDGVELGCVPKVFVDSEIRQDIQDGLVANIMSLKLKGNYYNLNDKTREYFVTDAGFRVDENVNFFYSQDFPSRIEIYGDRVAKPVGLEEGMGVLGFCYVPYHLVYDIDFPVLIQFFDDDEIFQFPVSVIISKNQKREALPTSNGIFADDRVCEFQNQEVFVYSYDKYLEPVEAQIRFKCLDSICDIGQTKISNGEAFLDGDFPQCVNGFILASSEGYADSRYQISTNEENFAHLILSKKYKINIDLGNVDMALVNFESEDFSATVLYPEMSEVELIEGYYNVSVYAYDNSSIVFPAVNERKCFDVPESGLAGVFGATKSQCHDIEIPAMPVSFAVVGGGKTSEYITSGDLENSRKLNINVPLFRRPSSLEDLQMNYELVEDEVIFIDFV